MKENTKISSLQIGTLTYFLSQVSFFPLISKILFKSTQQDIWISLIIGFLLGLVMLKLYFKLQDKLEDKNILEYNKIKFGNVLGNIINLILCIGIIVMTISIFSKFFIFINVNFLPNYPVLIIETSFILLILYAVKKGIETIFRSSQIFAIISILLIIISTILNSYNLNINNIFPIFEHKISNIISSSIYCALASTLPIFLLTIFKKNIVLEKENYNKSITCGYIMSFITTTILLITTLLILGKYLITSFEYPEFIAFKQIQYFYFIERIELVFSLIWIFNLFIFGVISMYFIFNYIKNTFNMKKNYTFVLVLIAILLILTTNIIVFLN